MKDVEFDIREYSFTNSSPKVFIRITHIPTGICVEGESEKSRVKLRRELVTELEEKIKDRK